MAGCVEQEHDNLRAALAWLIEKDNRGNALRLTGALLRFWWMHGYLNGGRSFLENLLPASYTLAPSTRAKAIVGAGVLTGAQGYYAQAETHCIEALRVFRELKDQQGIGTPLWMLGKVTYNQEPVFSGKHDGRRSAGAFSADRRHLGHHLLARKSDLGCS